jgi:tetratricopeptide (TPR) repeat protein
MQRTPHNHTHTSRTAACLVLAALTGTALLLAGCAASKPATDVEIKLPPSGERLAEAIRLTAKGQEAQTAGDAAVAIGFYKQAIALSADAPSAAWNNLGMLSMEQGNYREAAGYLSTAAQLAPLDPQPMYNLGLTYHKAGWDRQALEAFLGALDREPNYVGAIRGAATATMRLRETDEDALERLEHALLIETDPTWRSVFERERLAMEARLDIEDR